MPLSHYMYMIKMKKRVYNNLFIWYNILLTIGEKNAIIARYFGTVN